MDVVIPDLDPDANYGYRFSIDKAHKGFRLAGHNFKLITARKSAIQIWHLKRWGSKVLSSGFKGWKVPCADQIWCFSFSCRQCIEEEDWDDHIDIDDGYDLRTPLRSYPPSQIAFDSCHPTKMISLSTLNPEPWTPCRVQPNSSDKPPMSTYLVDNKAVL